MRRGKETRRCPSTIGTLALTLAFFMLAIQAQDPVEEARAQGWAAWEAFLGKPVEELVKDLQRDPTDLVVVQRLRMLDDPAAIGPLKKAFDSVQGQHEKWVIASTLLSLGVRDGPYFDFLARAALEAIRSETPSPLDLDDSDWGVSGRFAPGFLVWCRERGLDPGRTAYSATYEVPQPVQLLAWARDPRAGDILLEALDSPNLVIVGNGIAGLAFLGRKDAIEPINRAVGRFSRAMRPLEAAALLLFDDPRAQELARQWIPDEQTRAVHLRHYLQFLPSQRAKGQ